MIHKDFTKPLNKKLQALLEKEDKLSGSPTPKSEFGTSGGVLGGAVPANPTSKVYATVGAGLGAGLTEDQKHEATLVGKLPSGFPIDGWDALTTKQQLFHTQHSGLNPQEQWVLLNATAPLSVLGQHNQAQKEIETREYATKIVTTLMNTVSQTAAAKAQAAAVKPSNSTPLQNNGLRQKLDLLKEGFEKPPLGKASGGTGGVVPIKGTVEAGVGSAITNPDSSPKGFPFQFAAGTQPPTNTPGKTPAPTPTPTQLPQPGASPIIPVRTPTPFPANAECAYVFYTDTPGADFSKQAEYQKKALEKQGYRVKMVCVTNATTFSNAWNSMDPKTAAAVIISHCNGMSLIFEEGSSTNAISATGFGRKNNVLPSISSLEGPDVDEVYLYACNAGHEELLEEKGTNVADAFRDLPNIDTVYAYDGSVGFGIPIIRTLFPDTLFPHLSGEQDGYYDVFKNFNLSNEGASPSGLEIYYSEDEGDD